MMEKKKRKKKKEKGKEKLWGNPCGILL